MQVVATAGHVDHGKSTLVRALTGIDPDRWAEEKERGLTIDLGFAWTDLPSGRSFAFVDVPGHVRFLRNMLAGVGAVGAAVLVVDAGEGWMPQTEEHLRILELLGVRHGVVVLTKCRTVDADTLELAQLEVVDHVAGSFLEAAPVALTDAVAGMGLDDLRAELDRLLDALSGHPDGPGAGRPRLWVDRAFAATGAGTVVTGTLLGAPIDVGDELELHPGGAAVRVRGLQTHKANLDRAAPGTRVAVNITGVHHHDVGRGHVLVRPGEWHLTDLVDVELSVLPGIEHDVTRRGAYHLHLGSSEHSVPLRLLGVEALGPGTSGAARLHLPVTLPLLPGDRFVLRDAGREETVGGGTVLDVDPVLPASRARPDRSIERVLREREWVDADELERLTGERRPPLVGRWVVDPDARARVETAVAGRIDAAGALGLDVATLDERERSLLDHLEGVEVVAGRARRTGTDDPLAEHPWPAALAASPFEPPGPEGISADEVRALVRSGAVIERDGVHFAPSAIEQAAREVAAMLAAQPHGVTVAEVRDRLKTTRKFVLPILAELDGTGVTRRRGDVRVAGPRLPSL